MLANYSSLWEVFTAFFCSMLLDDILGNIWTPQYKKRVTGLIDGMGIPFVSTLNQKLTHQINVNVSEITGHMHRRAIFMICFCLCLLVLTGAECGMGFSANNITEIIFWASIIGIVVVMLGNWTFHSYAITTIVCAAYSAGFVILCHNGHEFEITWQLLADEKFAISFLLLFLGIPIIWQILSCWIYSSLYYGKLKEDIHKEEILYKKAIIGIRTNNMEVVPEKYLVRAAVDIDSQIHSNADISYESCDDILYASIDALLENPVPLKIFFSWVKFCITKPFRKKFADDSAFINKQFKRITKQTVPVSGLSHKNNTDKGIGSSSVAEAISTPTTK